MDVPDNILDVTDATFAAEVIETSRERAVVVDFWAPWCGPCRSLAPVLERAVAERPDEVTLARVNVDENPRVAAEFGVRSIPLVIGFRDGRPAAEFVGAQSETVVRQFIARLLPDEIDRAVAGAADARAAGDLGGAEAALRRALEMRPGHGAASLALGEILADGGRAAEALELLERATAEGPGALAIEQLVARLRLATGGGAAGEDEAGLRQRIEHDAGDLAARLALGRLLAALGRHEEAFETLLELVRRDRRFEDEAGRRAMLDLFALLGREDPLVDRYQRELARTLYS